MRTWAVWLRCDGNFNGSLNFALVHVHVHVHSVYLDRYGMPWKSSICKFYDNRSDHLLIGAYTTRIPILFPTHTHTHASRIVVNWELISLLLLLLFYRNSTRFFIVLSIVFNGGWPQRFDWYIKFNINIRMIYP